jgi:hypothetical protein
MSELKEPFFENMTRRLSEAELRELHKGLGKESDENHPVGDGSYDSFMKMHKIGRANLARMTGYCKVKPTEV